ncbi:structural maintenance of chromosomes protein 6A-like [Glycine soja]|nr:structural maintenance of chromosomes protein 6A-like [Glycine soja]
MVSHTLHQPTAGIVKQLRLENFMCHSKHETEFGNHVNFITGQNGSGKSTILAALCVAFGCRAKETQRTSTLKDFIKTGATDAVIQVEIQNEGEGAFKPEIYGPVIIVERRISESTSSATLKDHQGRKVVSWKTDLLEIVEHFNDAVSRKISLDPLVDFAEAHGSQRIFITPHDTSSVRAGDRIKKVQIAAPRS